MNLKKLAAELEKGNKKTREKIVDQIAMKQDEKATNILIDVLKNDPEASVRRRAALALGRIGNEQALDTLYDAMLNDEDSETRKNAAIALGKFGDERAILPLYELYAEPRKNSFFEKIDRARVNVTLLELTQKLEFSTIDELVAWKKEKEKNKDN